MPKEVLSDPLLNAIQNRLLAEKKNGKHIGEIHDGYHSFDELYEHRCILTAALFRMIPFTWKSKIHEDGTMFDGMFIVGCCTPDGSATYHYDLDDYHWNLFKIPEIPHAPKFDGHTPEIALARLEKYFTRGILQYNEEEVRRLEPVVKDVLDCFGDDEIRKNAYLNIFKKKKKNY